VIFVIRHCEEADLFAEASAKAEGRRGTPENYPTSKELDCFALLAMTA
jgi:hypothetical protein